MTLHPSVMQNVSPRQAQLTAQVWIVLASKHSSWQASTQASAGSRTKPAPFRFELASNEHRL